MHLFFFLYITTFTGKFVESPNSWKIFAVLQKHVFLGLTLPFLFGLEYIVKIRIGKLNVNASVNTRELFSVTKQNKG